MGNSADRRKVQLMYQRIGAIGKVEEVYDRVIMPNILILTNRPPYTVQDVIRVGLNYYLDTMTGEPTNKNAYR